MKPLFSALSPNIESDDLHLVDHLLKQGHKYQGEDHVRQLTDNAAHFLGVDRVFAFQNGRSALWAIVRSFDWPIGSEVILPGFTCAAAVNPFLWAGLKPIFADIDQSLNVDAAKIEFLVSEKTKAILVQHTFGLPADLQRIKEISLKHDLVLIEDCAHSLGASFQGRLLGTWGDASFFSLGRDKIISSVFGGLALANRSDLFSGLKKEEKQALVPSGRWIRQQLRHPRLVARWVQPWYGRRQAGRKMLLFFQKTGILSKAMTRREKNGGQIASRPGQMPKEMAVLAVNQLSKLERYNRHRAEIASFYRKELAGSGLILPCDGPGRIYLKFSLIMPDKDSADRALGYLRGRGIHLYDGWKDSPVVPSDVRLSAMGYQKGDCPLAEDLSSRLVNLPTHANISKTDAARIVRELKIFLATL